MQRLKAKLHTIKKARKAMLQGALKSWLRGPLTPEILQSNSMFNILLMQSKCWTKFYYFAVRNKLFDSIKAVLNAALN